MALPSEPGAEYGARAALWKYSQARRSKAQLVFISAAYFEARKREGLSLQEARSSEGPHPKCVTLQQLPLHPALPFSARRPPMSVSHPHVAIEVR